MRAQGRAKARHPVAKNGFESNAGEVAGSGEQGAGSNGWLQAPSSRLKTFLIMNEALFRFENMEIWQRAAAISGRLFQLAEQLDRRKYFRFAEQLRAATLSITNNIAEGSGSASDVDFANFLNIARRSVYEVANMLMLFTREKYLLPNESESLLPELAEQSRMIHAFRKTLKAQ